MKRWNSWGLSVALLCLTAIAPTVSSLAATLVTTNSPASAPSHLQAQSASDTLCRRVTARQGLAIRQQPDPNAPQVGGVDFQGQVTLAGNGEGVLGPDNRIWLEVSSPVAGYLSNGQPNSWGNLEPCSGSLTSSTPTPVPPETTTPSETPTIPDGPLCRQVNGLVTPQGLAVRSEPGGASSYIGGIPGNGRVQLIEDYEYVRDKYGANISWVKIVAPIEGFVSVNSLIRCF